MGQAKGREIAYQLLSQAKQDQLGKDNVIYSYLKQTFINLGSGKQKDKS